MKILILTAATGVGHLRASSALKSYILETQEDCEVEIVDTLKYISPLLDKTVTEGYEAMAKRTPKLFGSLYKSTNRGKSKTTYFFCNIFRKYLMPLVEEFRPDAIISTHPFATEMISLLKEDGKITAPLICVMTDYGPHRAWIHPYVDSYIVSNEGMVDTMAKMGAPREKIHPYGIPVEESFYEKMDRAEVLRQLGLSPDKPTVLIMAGSFGVSNILRIYNNIIKVNLDFQIIVITGKNERLYEAFNKLILRNSRQKPLRDVSVKLKPKPSKPTKVLFFTNEVHKYMQISDLIITKPGGLTVSEALACNLPMAIFDAIPGPETENAEFLIDNNMAVKIQKGSACSDTIYDLLSNQERLEEMRRSCSAFDKSSSGPKIVNEIQKLVKDEKRNPFPPAGGKVFLLKSAIFVLTIIKKSLYDVIRTFM